MLVGVVVGVLLGLGAQAYWDRRLGEHPCADAIALLSAAARQRRARIDTIATPQTEVWRDMYPWLHTRYDVRIVEGYNPEDRPAAEVMADKLQTLAEMTGGFYWIEQGERPADDPAAQAFAAFAAATGADVAELQELGACRVTRVALPAQP